MIAAIFFMLIFSFGLQVCAAEKRICRFLTVTERRIRGEREFKLDLKKALHGKLVAVTAGRIKGRKILSPETLIDLYGRVSEQEDIFLWQVPEGTWAILFFSEVTEEMPALQPPGDITPLPFMISKSEKRIRFSENFFSLYKNRFGEKFSVKELAALLYDIGNRTELVRFRLNSISMEVSTLENGTVPRKISVNDPKLPFLVHNPCVYFDIDCKSIQTACYYGWNFKAVSGLGDPGPGNKSKSFVLLRPHRDNWRVKPLCLRFYLDLAYMWGARGRVDIASLPDYLRFSFLHGVTSDFLPRWRVENGAAMRDPPQILVGAKNAAETCIAVVREGLLAEGKLGLGPAIAAALSSSCRDYCVTTLDDLEKKILPANSLPHIKQIIIPQNKLLETGHAKEILNWMKRGLRIVFAGPFPVASPGQGRNCTELNLLIGRIKKQENFFHADNPEETLEYLDKIAPAPVQVVEGAQKRIFISELEKKGRPVFFLLNTFDLRWHGRFFLPGKKVAVFHDPACPFSIAPPQSRTGKGLYVEMAFEPYQGLILETGPTVEALVENGTMQVKGAWKLIPFIPGGHEQGRSTGAVTIQLKPQTVWLYRERTQALNHLTGARNSWIELDKGSWIDLSKGSWIDLSKGSPKSCIDLPRWHGVWITGPEIDLTGSKPSFYQIHFARTFFLDLNSVEARLTVAAETDGLVQVNSSKAFSVEGGTVLTAEVAGFIKLGKNEIKAQVKYPGKLLVELVIRTFDGKKRIIVTDNRWRVSLRKNGWKHALELKRPENDFPGPLSPAPDKLWGLVKVPLGVSRIDMSPGWEKRCFLSSGGEVVTQDFRSLEPVFLLFKVNKGDVDSPLFTFEPVKTKLAPLSRLGFSNFAGNMIYEARFCVSESQVSGSGSKAIIDLGEVGDFAKVFLDGKQLLGAFSFPYRYPVEKISAGDHILRVEVSTLSAPMRHCMMKSSGDFRTGLVGPVRIIYLKKI